MADQKKSARILTSYYKPKPGGFCTRYFRAIEALLSNGNEVHYLAVSKFPIDDENCHFHRFPWPEQFTDNILFWFILHLFSPVILLFLGYRYKISHAFAFGPTYSLMLQPLSILKKIPLTLFLRADIIENYIIKGTSKWIVFIERFLEGLSIFNVRLYGVSESLAKNIVARHSYFRPKLASILRNDILANRPGVEVSPKKKLRMGCVGILEKRKNQIFLIKLMQYLDKYDIELLIFGVGPNESLLRKITKNYDVERQVVFKGWVDRENIWPSIDLLLMPSLHEGAPNAVLEAIAVNMPVLASDIPEHREILPDQCLLPLGKLEQWVTTIVSINTNKESKLKELQNAVSGTKTTLVFDWDTKVRNLILTS